MAYFPFRPQDYEPGTFVQMCIDNQIPKKDRAWYGHELLGYLRSTGMYRNATPEAFLGMTEIERHAYGFNKQRIHEIVQHRIDGVEYRPSHIVKFLQEFG